MTPCYFCILKKNQLTGKVCYLLLMRGLTVADLGLRFSLQMPLSHGFCSVSSLKSQKLQIYDLWLKNSIVFNRFWASLEKLAWLLLNLLSFFPVLSVPHVYLLPTGPKPVFSPPCASIKPSDHGEPLLPKLVLP